MNEIDKSKTINEVAKGILAKTLLSAIPVGGQLAVIVWDAVDNYVLMKRRAAWEKALEARLSKIERTVEQVANNDLFISAVLTATPIAIKTGIEKKREYLANAVANTVKEKVDESKLIVFFNLLDKYTIWHVMFLKYVKGFSYSNKKINNISSEIHDWSGITFRGLLTQKYPELENDPEYIEKILQDLETDGLIRRNSIRGFLTKDTVFGDRVSALGEDFLSFISE